MSVSSNEVDIRGSVVRLERHGAGPTVVFLHGEDGLLFARPFIQALASQFEVVVPLHPGWGSARPAHVRSLDDIAYLYLGLLELLEDRPVLVGTSLGAWLAAEILTKNDGLAAGAVMVAPVGIKTAGREQRSFVDVFASSADEVVAALYSDPSRAPDLTALDDDDFLELVTAQEAVARYAWEPYMHNPQLLSRLGRIRVPALVVGGSEDRFVLEADYCAKFASLVGDGARAVAIAGAGHRVEEEAPEALCELISEFVKNDVFASATSIPRRS